MTLLTLIGLSSATRRSWPPGKGIAADGADVEAPPFATVRVVDTLEAAAAAWSRLEAIALCSPYQRRDWVEAWMDTEGRAAGITPMIVIASDGEHRPVALLALGIERRGPIRRAIFLGGRQTNYKMGLFDPRCAWTAADAARLLRLAARQPNGRVDLFALTDQPLAWLDFSNPLAGLPRSQPSPSFSHRAELDADGDAFLRRHQSAAGRKKLRTKAAYLATLGPVSHRRAGTRDEIAATVAAHLSQKAAKLTALGIAVPDLDALRHLFERAAAGDGDAAPLELHALYCGDRIVATFGGLARAGRFSGVLISYEVEAPFARSSPGELLLVAVIKAKCAEGFVGFDLGIGEARYKDSYCPIDDPLVDGFFALTPMGMLTAGTDAVRLRLKAAIKQSPRAWAAVQAIRKRLGRLRRVG